MRNTDLNVAMLTCLAIWKIVCVLWGPYSSRTFFAIFAWFPQNAPSRATAAAESRFSPRAPRGYDAKVSRSVSPSRIAAHSASLAP